MKFRRVDPYHGVSECGLYTIARMNASPESTYMAWRATDRKLLGCETFTHLYDEAGQERADNDARISAWNACVALCVADSEQRRTAHGV